MAEHSNDEEVWQLFYAFTTGNPPSPSCKQVQCELLVLRSFGQELQEIIQTSVRIPDTC